MKDKYIKSEFIITLRGKIADLEQDIATLQEVKECLGELTYNKAYAPLTAIKVAISNKISQISRTRTLLEDLED